MRQSTGKLIVPVLGAATLALTVTMIAGGAETQAARDDGIDRQRSVTWQQRRERLFARRRAYLRREVVEPAPPVFPEEHRSIDGFGNNRLHPKWGAAGYTLRRLTPVTYGDGVETPAGADRPNVRDLSNALFGQSESQPSARGATALLWHWARFVDHDLSEAPSAEPTEPFDIFVPAGDAWLDPGALGGATMPLDRSAFAMIDDVRQQLNAVSAYVDASTVYGADDDRAQALRTLDGTGRLKTTARDMPPLNSLKFPNEPTADDPFLFFAGDRRVNEDIGLTALHALFVREHNYWAGRWSARLGDDATGEQIYQHARATVVAEIQAITYREFLPLLLGDGALPAWGGYDAAVDAGVSNVFATAANRVGQTMMSSPLMRLDAHGDEIPAGHLPLAEAYYNPRETMEQGIDVTIRGMAAQAALEFDHAIVDEVRNSFLDPTGGGGIDLAALNIQRGRDHGLATYNQVREAFGLATAATFADISPDPAVQDALAAAYDNVDQLDAWVGMLCEQRVGGTLVGETIRAVLVEQFTRLRDGDRFWYESYLPSHMLAELEQQTLATIIERNTDVRFVDGRNPFILEGFVPQPCTNDTDGNATVDVQDLLAVLGNWGACPVDAACPADVDGNNTVDVQDLLGVLGAWGDCD